MFFFNEEHDWSDWNSKLVLYLLLTNSILTGLVSILVLVISSIKSIKSWIFKGSKSVKPDQIASQDNSNISKSNVSNSNMVIINPIENRYNRFSSFDISHVEVSPTLIGKDKIIQR